MNCLRAEGRTHFSSSLYSPIQYPYTWGTQASTHPDCKVVHTVHLQVLSDLQIFHFCFVPARRMKDTVTGVGKTRGRTRQAELRTCQKMQTLQIPTKLSLLTTPRSSRISHPHEHKRTDSLHCLLASISRFALGK